MESMTYRRFRGGLYGIFGANSPQALFPPPLVKMKDSGEPFFAFGPPFSEFGRRVVAKGELCSNSGRLPEVTDCPPANSLRFRQGVWASTERDRTANSSLGRGAVDPGFLLKTH